jgi:hypothetical protein
MTKKGEHFIRFPTAGRVVVVSKDDKRICKHENLVKYCIRDSYQYYFCLDCKNLVREEMSKEEPKMNVLDKIKNKIKGGK